MFLLTPDLGLLCWMVLCFGILVFILGKFAWPMITGMIEERSNYIEESLKKADEANAALANLRRRMPSCLLRPRMSVLRC